MRVGEKLLAELEDAKEARHGTEKEREELVKKAKNLQNKTQTRRNHGEIFYDIILILMYIII